MISTHSSLFWRCREEFRPVKRSNICHMITYKQLFVAQKQHKRLIFVNKYQAEAGMDYILLIGIKSLDECCPKI